jgi:hypothetical protein
MAGSAMTFTYDDGVCGAGLRTRYRTITVVWTSDSASGGVAGTTRKICGRIVKAITFDTAGGSSPSNGYAIAITESGSGANVLTPCQSTLASVANASTVQTYFLIKDSTGTPVAQAMGPIVQDKLTITVSSAGNSKNGTLILTVEQ